MLGLQFEGVAIEFPRPRTATELPSESKLSNRVLGTIGSRQKVANHPTTSAGEQPSPYTTTDGSESGRFRGTIQSLDVGKPMESIVVAVDATLVISVVGGLDAAVAVAVAVGDTRRSCLC